MLLSALLPCCCECLCFCCAVAATVCVSITKQLVYRGVVQRRRNLREVRQDEEQREDAIEMEQDAKRIRATPGLYKEFKVYPEVEAWKTAFGPDGLRFPLLIILAGSDMGKTDFS